MLLYNLLLLFKDRTPPPVTAKPSDNKITELKLICYSLQTHLLISPQFHPFDTTIGQNHPATKITTLHHNKFDLSKVGH